VLDYAEKKDLKNVSLTGVRAILLLQLLIEAPRTLDEIKKEFVKLGILEENSSDYILRLDMASLKEVGCKISRANKSNNYKYILEEHPFSLDIKEEEIKVLSKLYKKVKEKADVELLLSFDILFKKLAEQVSNKEIKEGLLGISVLKQFNTSIIKDFLLDCTQKRTLNLIYKNPAQKNEKVMEIVAQEFIFKNDKFYLYAFDLNKKESVILDLKRIVKILSRKLKKDIVYTEKFYTKFKLKNVSLDVLEKNEKIVETLPDGFIVEGYYYNDFIASQRVLSFTTNCTVLEPEDFKNSIISKLENMRKLYGI